MVLNRIKAYQWDYISSSNQRDYQVL